MCVPIFKTATITRKDRDLKDKALEKMEHTAYVWWLWTYRKHDSAHFNVLVHFVSGSRPAMYNSSCMGKGPHRPTVEATIMSNHHKSTNQALNTWRDFIVEVAQAYLSGDWRVASNCKENLWLTQTMPRSLYFPPSHVILQKKEVFVLFPFSTSFGKKYKMQISFQILPHFLKI